MDTTWTVYQEPTFGLWGLLTTDQIEEAGFDTEADAQTYADAYNNGCASKAEADEYIASLLPPEVELTTQEWFDSLRHQLANTRAAIHQVDNDLQRLCLQTFQVLADAGLDEETVAKRRAELLLETGLAHRGNAAQEWRNLLAEQVYKYEERLKTYGLQLYQETMEKHLGGVEITARKDTRLLVPESVALEYGQKYIPNLVKTVTTWTHKTKFFAALRDRLTKGIDDEIPGIVELVETPSARVLDDLSEYVSTEEAPPPGFIDEEEIPF